MLKNLEENMEQMIEQTGNFITELEVFKSNKNSVLKDIISEMKNSVNELTMD